MYFNISHFPYFISRNRHFYFKTCEIRKTWNNQEFLSEGRKDKKVQILEELHTVKIKSEN